MAKVAERALTTVLVALAQFAMFAGAVFAALLVCLAPGVAAPAAASGVLVPPPDDVVVTYEGRSDGSFGSRVGRVVRTATRTEWRGRPVIAIVSPDEGGVLCDPQTYATVAYLDREGRPTHRFEPPIGLPWPLEVGKSVNTAHQLIGERVKELIPMQVHTRVEGYEEVTVPAGTFKAFRISRSSSLGGMPGSVSQIWVVPSLGLVGLHALRSIEERPNMHWLGPGRREWSMVDRTVRTR